MPLVNVPAVRCRECGTPIDESPNTPPGKRQPCPKCGSRLRDIRVFVSDQLQLIDEAYAETTAAANERIQQLMSAQAQVALRREGTLTADAVVVEAGHAAGAGTAYDATVKTDIAIAGELAAERDHLTQAAIHTLIDTVRVGQAENARAAEKLNGLTVELVRWTRVLGGLTVLVVLVSLAALVVGIYAAVK